MRQQHDYWHVLTEFKTDVTGELGLQAFTYAPVGALISPLIIAGGLLHLAFRDPGSMRAAFESIVDGYRLGVRCRSLVTLRLENEWITDLDTLRARLGISNVHSAMEPPADPRLAQPA